MDVNYKGTVNLLEAIKNHSPQTKILLAGTAEEYGEVAKEDLPVVAKTYLQPVNPYAVSKIAQDLIGYVYYKSYGLNVIRTKAFNYEGARRDNVFGISWYAYQVVRIELGLQKPIIRTGLRNDQRTFMHVKDLVRAYWLAIDKCVPGKLYLIGADEKEHIFTFDQVLDMLIKRLKLQRAHLLIVILFILTIAFERRNFLLALNESQGDKLAVDVGRAIREQTLSNELVSVAPLKFSYSRRYV